MFGAETPNAMANQRRGQLCAFLLQVAQDFGVTTELDGGEMEDALAEPVFTAPGEEWTCQPDEKASPTAERGREVGGEASAAEPVAPPTPARVQPMRQKSVASAMGGDDAFDCVLQRLCLADLCALKPMAPSWREAARRVLCSPRYQRSVRLTLMSCVKLGAPPTILTSRLAADPASHHKVGAPADILHCAPPAT